MARNRRRTTEAVTVRRINAKARERMDAYLDGGHPNMTQILTTDLDELFDDRREETAGSLRDPYYGRTMAFRKDRVTVGRTVKAKRHARPRWPDPQSLPDRV